MAKDTGDFKEIYWFEQRLRLNVERENALIILATVKDKHCVGWN